MKLKAMLLGLSIMAALPASAQKPVYLDTNTNRRASKRRIEPDDP